MALCELTDLKARLGVTSADYDGVLGGIITGVSAQLAAAAGRLYGGSPCLEKTDLVALFSPENNQRDIWVPAWPIVSIEKIVEAMFGDFDDADELTEDTDFYLDAAAGRIIRIGRWPPGQATVRVTYTGGYLAAGEEASEGEEGNYAMPANIIEAAIKQCSFVFQRRDKLGLSGESAGGASISLHAPDKLLPDVAETMRLYRRLV